MPRNTQEKYVLAIDLGSGGPKVGIVSSTGELLTTAQRSVETAILPEGGAEQDPDAWWQAISAAAREVIRRGPISASEIDAISCDSQWSVTTPVDRDGRPLMNALHWMDSRGAPYTKAITDGFPKVAGYGLRRLIQWLRYTGGAPTHSGVDVLAHILFIKHARPDVYDQTYKFLEPMDYINLRLTGKFSASFGTIFPYLLTDNRDNLAIDYSPRLLGLAGIDREKLPDLVPVDTMLGPMLPDVAADWGLPDGVQVVAGSNDSQSAVLGSGAVGDCEGHMCVGTSSWISCHVPFKRTDLIRFVATMPAAIPGRNMVVAEQGAAGKCLELFLRNWIFSDDKDLVSCDGDGPCPLGGDVYARAFELAAAVPPGSDGLLYLPWLNGAGPPLNDGDARGGFLNQSLRTSRAEATRAVMEGVSYNLRWLLDAVERFVSRRFETLNFIGGSARSELWCQIHADVLNRPIRKVAQPNDAILRGAGLMGHLARGNIKLEELSDCVPIERTFEPNPANLAVYDRMFDAFCKAYRSNRRLFGTLQKSHR